MAKGKKTIKLMGACLELAELKKTPIMISEISKAIGRPNLEEGPDLIVVCEFPKELLPDDVLFTFKLDSDTS